MKYPSSSQVLLPARAAFCEYWGWRRAQNAIENRRQGKARQSSDANIVRRNHVDGIRGEAGCMLYFYAGGISLKWHLHNIDGADFEDWIDVKAIQQPQHRLQLPLDAKLHKDWAYVLVYGGEWPWQHLLGFNWGQDFVDKATVIEPQPGRACYRLERKVLRPMEELFDEVCRRIGLHDGSL